MIGLGISCPGDPGCPGGTANPALALGPPNVFDTPSDSTPAITPSQVVNPIGFDSSGNPIYPSGTPSGSTFAPASGCPSGLSFQASPGGNVLGSGGQQGICIPAAASLIPGVSNTVLYAAAGGLVLLILATGGRR